MTIYNLPGLTMEARQRPPALGIGRRSFFLDAGVYELTVPESAIYFSSWGLDDYYHTALVPYEGERWMEILEEPRDAFVATKRIGYTQ